MLTSDMKIGKIYTLSTYSAAFIGSMIKNVKLLAIVDSVVARTIQPIDQLYAQIYPTLPQGTPYDIDKTLYFVFSQVNGDKIVIADVWIVPNSVILVQSIDMVITVHNANLGDQNIVASALRSLGIENFNIELT